MSQRKESETDNSINEFEQQGEGPQYSLIREFIIFMAENKKWWLLPILLALALLGIMASLASTGAAPFIYTIF